MAVQAWHRGRGHGSSCKVWHRRFVHVFLCSKALLSPWQKSCFLSFSLLFLSLQCLCELRRKQPNKKQHSSGSKLHLLGKPWDHHLTSSHLTWGENSPGWNAVENIELSPSGAAENWLPVCSCYKAELRRVGALLDINMNANRGEWEHKSQR